MKLYIYIVPKTDTTSSIKSIVGVNEMHVCSRCKVSPTNFWFDHCDGYSYQV